MFQNLCRKCILRLSAVLLCSLIFSVSSKGQEAAIGGIQLRKFLMAEAALKAMYVDTLNDEKLIEDAVEGMLKELDPHSRYTPLKDVRSLTEPLQGNFDGIGVQFSIVEDTLLVIQPVVGGPSEKVGILAGDRIITVNDTSIAGVKMTQEQIMKRLRGPKGTKVKIGILRRGIKGIHDFTVVRDKIPVNSLDAKYMVDDKIGYVRFGSFGATTHEEFVSAVKELKSQGMKDLIIDLQSNGGGYLGSAVAICNELLNNGDLIVYTKGRRQPRMNYSADGNGIFLDGKVAILIDSYSASASEILAGAIQDNDRGIIVGRRSFGKGLVQSQVDLPDGSLMRITTAHYYSPSGRCIQKPYVKGSESRNNYEKDIENRLNSGELTNGDSIHFPDSLKFQTLKKKRTVYGGGGIMPDVYVNLDTTQYTRLYREIAAKGEIIRTSLKYIDHHRKQLTKKYPNFKIFKEKFEVDENAMEILKEELKKDKIKFTDEELEKSLSAIKLHFKSLVARDLWSVTEYFQIFNEDNAIYRAGVEAIRKSEN